MWKSIKHQKDDNNENKNECNTTTSICKIKRFETKISKKCLKSFS